MKVDLLKEYGIIFDNFAEEIGKDYGVFDLICHIAYEQPRAVLEALLDKYADEGLSTLESNKVLKLKPFTNMGAPMEIVKNAFGSKAVYDQAIQNLEQELFKQDSA